jgi:hypothetical protein
VKDLLCERSITYQNDIQHSYMVIEMLQSDEIIDYQVRMIQENPVRHLLPLLKKQIDKDVYIYYDITSKITLNQLLKRIKVNKHEFLTMLKSLITGLRQGNSYLLQGGSFVLHSDYIYVDPSTLEVSIAYLPISVDLDINQVIKEWLLDLIIYKVSFETNGQGDFVYELLNLIKSESFSLNQLDKAISTLVLQQKFMTSENNLDELIQKTNTQNTATGFKIKEDPHYNKSLVFIFLQMLFIAVTILFLRYFYFMSKTPDITRVVGIAVIAIAVDILLIKRLELIRKSLVQSKTPIKTGEPKKVFIQKNIKHKPTHGLGVSNSEYAAAKESMQYINPRDFETKVLIEDEDYPPYLQSSGENDKEKIYIDKPSFIIGRLKSQSDYISKNNAVGKLHAEIINRDDAYYLKDLNSRNGTYINGERIVSNVEYSIQNNDRVSFANSEYKFLRS